MTMMVRTTWSRNFWAVESRQRKMLETPRGLLQFFFEELIVCVVCFMYVGLHVCQIPGGHTLWPTRR